MTRTPTPTPTPIVTRRRCGLDPDPDPDPDPNLDQAALRLQLDELRSGEEQSRAALRQAQREATTAAQA